MAIVRTRRVGGPQAGRPSARSGTSSGGSRTGSAAASASAGDVHPKMEIVAEGGTVFVVPYAPRETTTEGFGPEWERVARGGRRPLLIEGAQGLPTMSFSLIVAYPDWNETVEPILKDLQDLVESGARMAVTLDRTSARFRWRLTGYSQQVVSRQHGSNKATRAVCDFTFQVVSDPPHLVGKSKKGGKGGKDRPKFVTFKKGDTLQSIAKEHYGDASKWRAIADANKIRDPKAIKPGTRIRLP